MPTVQPTSTTRAALSPDATKRLRRLQKAAWVLDRSIPIGGGRRIGLDPLIGLVPGLGDWLGAGLSLYFIYEATRLGLPFRILARMGLNVVIETLVGAIPVAGDIFDFAWQANMRNLRLVERHYRPTLSPRPLRRIVVTFGVAAGAFLVLVAATLAAIAWLLIRLFSA